MKKTFWFLLGFWLVFSFGISHAADLKMGWDPSKGATGYKLYMSLDNGKTWDAGVDVGNVTEYLYKDVVETGLVLFRVSAYNDSCEVINWDSMVAYNYLWKPPDRTTGLGIQEVHESQ